MPKMRLTRRSVEHLSAPHPSGKQVLIWDDELRGFGVLLSGSTNVHTYIVQRRIGEAGRKRRDRPPLKWSAVSYGFCSKEDHDAEEDLQA